MTPKVAGRIAVIAAAIAAIVGVLVVRLWFLQVVSAPAYAAAAVKNRVRTISQEAERGIVVDRHNVPLIQNRAAQNVVMHPQEFKLLGKPGPLRLVGSEELPTLSPEQLRTVRRLARITSRPLGDMRLRARRGLKENPSGDTVLAGRINASAVNYLAERRRDFPGIGLSTTFLRSYPNKDLAAHVLGQVAPIFKEEQKQAVKAGVPLDSKIGKGGIELQYESFLRGSPGSRQVEVDAAGNVLGPGPISTPPQQGDTLRLSLDIATSRALANAVAAQVARVGAPGGAGIALDPNTGQILGIASVPSYDPKILVDGGINPGPVRALDNYRKPQVNRAISGRYPSASTFKPFSMIAAIQDGLLTPDEAVDCPSSVELYGTKWPNFGLESFGFVTLPVALEVSCDTYVYKVAERIYKKYESTTDTVMQDWARVFGYGTRTGIDLPGEDPGTLPDLKWKESNFINSPSPSDSKWLPGDTINLSVGQGNLSATPLQVAVSYAALVNGGRLVTPTLARQLVRADGSIERDFTNANPPRDIVLRGKRLTPEILSSVRDGLYRVANGPDGTAYSVFKDVPEGLKVAGKTGTAENKIKGQVAKDHSWFVGYAPHDKPKIVVAVIIENGGTGSSAAAPAVCQTIASHLRFPVDLCGDGTGDAEASD